MAREPFKRVEDYEPEEYEIVDHETVPDCIKEFYQEMAEKIIGQERVVDTVTTAMQSHWAHLDPPKRPKKILLLLGPTGSGKTRTVQAFCEVLYGRPDWFVTIDCAEFQEHHEISKLIGSPPGYLGHRETVPLLTQSALAKYHTEKAKFTVILFDEIEKGSYALRRLLLGILDRGTLTLGDNSSVDLSQTMIFMTSNLGSKEMSDLISDSIGFVPPRKKEINIGKLDQKIYEVAKLALARRFEPEFINRIDKVIVFRSLTTESLYKILVNELELFQKRLFANGIQVILRYSQGALDFLVDEGTDYKYGARPLKRTIERYLVPPISNLFLTKKIELGDILAVDFDPAKEELFFKKIKSSAIVNSGGVSPQKKKKLS